VGHEESLLRNFLTSHVPAPVGSQGVVFPLFAVGVKLTEFGTEHALAYLSWGCVEPQFGELVWSGFGGFGAIGIHSSMIRFGSRFVRVRSKSPMTLLRVFLS